MLTKTSPLFISYWIPFQVGGCPVALTAFSCLQGVWTYTYTVHTTYWSKYSWGIVITHLFISFDHSASPQGGGMAEMGQPLGGRGCTIGNRGSPTWYDIFFFFISCYINVFTMIKSDLFVGDKNNDLIPFPLIVVKSVKDSIDRKPQLKKRTGETFQNLSAKSLKCYSKTWSFKL